MSASRTIRILTVAYLGLHLTTSLVLPQLHAVQDENVARLLQYSGYGGILNASNPVFYALSALPLIASVGLFWLRNWGRILLLIATLLNLVGALAFGVSVSDALGSFFAYLTVLSSGALLGIVFLTQARQQFDTPEAG